MRPNIHIALNSETNVDRKLEKEMSMAVCFEAVEYPDLNPAPR